MKKGFIKVILAWSLFAGGVALQLSADYYLRLRDGNIWTGGLGDLLWVLLPILLGGGAIYLAYLGSASLSSRWLRLVVVMAQGILGFLLYTIVVLAYTLETGIDSL